MKTEFSVCMSVYKNDNTTDFSVAIDNILYQTVLELVKLCLWLRRII